MRVIQAFLVILVSGFLLGMLCRSPKRPRTIKKLS